MTDDTFEGGCDCRAVRYRLRTRPMWVNCCHCRWCQRETGSAFVINAMIETDRVELLAGPVDIVDTPSHSGKGQRIARCPTCRVAVWSHYSSPLVSFVRVGTLDDPDRFPPDVHIFTTTKQPWVQLSGDVPVMPEYYRTADLWPPESIARRNALLAHK